VVEMRVATKIINIRPNKDVYLVGYNSKERSVPAIGVHDDPYATALLLEVDHQLLLFISLDVAIIHESKASVIKTEIMRYISIPSENIVINTTHTHSGPSGFDDFDKMSGIPDNSDYFKDAVTRIIDGIKNIEKDLVEVNAVIGSTKVEGYYSNRNDINRPYNDKVTIIKFMDKEEICVAAMCNINCHATVLGPTNQYISADLMGKVRDLLSETLGVKPYMFSGAGGDVSNRLYRKGNDFNELDRVGNGITAILNNIVHYQPLQLNQCKITDIVYTVNYDNNQYFDTYSKKIEMNEALLKTDMSFDDRKLRTSELGALKEKMKKEKIHFDVKSKVIQLGDLTLVVFPGELASVFHRKLEADCSTPYFLIIGYANDFQMYFIEEEEYGKHFETIVSDLPKGESEKIVKQIGTLL